MLQAKLVDNKCMLVGMVVQQFFLMKAPPNLHILHECTFWHVWPTIPRNASPRNTNKTEH